MSSDLPSSSELPDELAIKIHEMALRAGCSEEDTLEHVLQLFMEMVDNPRNESDECLVKRVRDELRRKYGERS